MPKAKGEWRNYVFNEDCSRRDFHRELDLFHPFFDEPCTNVPSKHPKQPDSSFYIRDKNVHVTGFVDVKWRLKPWEWGGRRDIISGKVKAYFDANENDLFDKEDRLIGKTTIHNPWVDIANAQIYRRDERAARLLGGSNGDIGTASIKFKRDADECGPGNISDLLILSSRSWTAITNEWLIGDSIKIQPLDGEAFDLTTVFST